MFTQKQHSQKWCCVVLFGLEWLIVFVCIYLSIFNTVDRSVDKIIFNNFETKKKRERRKRRDWERIRELWIHVSCQKCFTNRHDKNIYELSSSDKVYIIRAIQLLCQWSGPDIYMYSYAYTFEGHFWGKFMRVLLQRFTWKFLSQNCMC